jgi:hypothetical protein
LSKVYATQQSSLCESKQSATARVQQGRQSAGAVPLDHTRLYYGKPNKIATTI